MCCARATASVSFASNFGVSAVVFNCAAVMKQNSMPNHNYRRCHLCTCELRQGNKLTIVFCTCSFNHKTNPRQNHAMSRSRQLQATRSTLAAAEFFKRINYTLTCKLLLTLRCRLVHGLVMLQLAVERGPLATQPGNSQTVLKRMKLAAGYIATRLSLLRVR